MVPLAGRTVLVVEDDYSSLEVLVLLMTGEGITTVPASDGEEAWASLGADPSIALVVTDYMMPRLNGIELYRRMQADPRLREIPVILMSATLAKLPGPMPGIVAFFQKPLLFGKLLGKVHDVLSRPAAP